MHAHFARHDTNMTTLFSRVTSGIARVFLFPPSTAEIQNAFKSSIEFNEMHQL